MAEPRCHPDPLWRAEASPRAVVGVKGATHALPGCSAQALEPPGQFSLPSLLLRFAELGHPDSGSVPSPPRPPDRPFHRLSGTATIPWGCGPAGSRPTSRLAATSTIQTSFDPLLATYPQRPSCEKAT